MTLQYSLAAIAASLAFALPASATTIDFEDFAGKPTVAQGTFFEGVAAAAGEDLGGLSFDSELRVGQFRFSDGPATDGFIALKTDSIFNPKTYDVVGTFAGTVNSLTLGAGDSGGDLDNVTLRGFAADGTLVDEDSFSARSSQFLTISGTGIAYFELNTVSGGFDNISFDLIAAVPVPASLPLILAGLGGLVALRRRKNTA